MLTDEDLAALPLATEREIEVLEFVPADQVDPILFDKTYYLEPEQEAAKPYALLREALAQTDRMAVVKVALRQRESHGDAAGARQRDRAADPAVARRGPRARLRHPRRRRRRCARRS